MIKRIRNRQGDRRLERALTALAQMSPEEAAAALRKIITEGHDEEIHGEILARIAERAAEGAPEAGKQTLARYAEIYRSGRLVRFGTFDTKILEDADEPVGQLEVDDALIASVEEAFSKENES